MEEQRSRWQRLLWWRRPTKETVGAGDRVNVVPVRGEPGDTRLAIGFAGVPGIVQWVEVTLTRGEAYAVAHALQVSAERVPRDDELDALADVEGRRWRKNLAQPGRSLHDRSE